MSWYDRLQRIMLIALSLWIKSYFCTEVIVDRARQGLTDVPSDISTDVTELTLQENSITAIEDYAFSEFSRLRLLNLEQNLIRAVSSSAFRGTVLENLILTSNQLKAVPDLEDVRETLEALSVPRNKITEFNRKVCSETLTKLALGYNSIKFISPAAFKECTALEQLYLTSNLLTTVGELSVKTLQKIMLNGNSMTCDSRLLWLKAFKEREGVIYDLTCANPARLQGRLFSSVSKEELVADDPLLDGNNFTCITIPGSNGFYKSWVTFPTCATGIEVMSVTVLGDYLQCEGDDGLELYVNTKAIYNTDRCDLGQELRVCSLMEENQPTTCKFLCPWPVGGGACKFGFFYWNRSKLSSNHLPGKICKVEAAPGP